MTVAQTSVAQMSVVQQPVVGTLVAPAVAGGRWGVMAG